MKRLVLRAVSLGVVAALSSAPAYGQSPPSPTAPPTPEPSPTQADEPTPPPARVPSPASTPEEEEEEKFYYSGPLPKADDKPETAREKLGTNRRQGKRAAAKDKIWWEIGYRYPGTYSTDRLKTLVARLRKLEADPARRFYAPFIVAGPARFWDSWGEVRKAEHGLRPHLGQDVFCSYGTPVLASQEGKIQFGADASGGLVARLFRPEGGYWYYAHLSALPENLSSGDQVEAGDVVGYCGNSGNALGSEAHVHFGLYLGGLGSSATNPMPALVDWLEAAERRVERAIRRATARLQKESARRGQVVGVRQPLDPQMTDLTGKPCIPVVEQPTELIAPTLS